MTRWLEDLHYCFEARTPNLQNVIRPRNGGSAVIGPRINAMKARPKTIPLVDKLPGLAFRADSLNSTFCPKASSMAARI